MTIVQIFVDLVTWGTSINDDHSTGVGGGHSKVTYSSKLQVINQSNRGGRVFKKS